MKLQHIELSTLSIGLSPRARESTGVAPLLTECDPTDSRFDGTRHTHRRRHERSVRVAEIAAPMAPCVGHRITMATRLIAADAVTIAVTSLFMPRGSITFRARALFRPTRNGMGASH